MSLFCIPTITSRTGKSDSRAWAKPHALDWSRNCLITYGVSCAQAHPKKRQQMEPPVQIQAAELRDIDTLVEFNKFVKNPALKKSGICGIRLYVEPSNHMA